MGENRQGGFTIIEVMIFLAVSGLLLFGIMAGTGTAIARQRYNDGVQSAQSFFQKQFDETLSVNNDRPSNQACANSTVTAGSDPRGASQCFILGKAMEFNYDSDPGKIKVYQVIGSEPIGGGTPSSEAQVISQYNPALVEPTSSEYELPWDMSVSGTQRVDGSGVSATNPAVRLLTFLRSPRSGAMVIFSYPSMPNGNRLNNFPAGQSLLTVTNKTSHICVQSPDFGSQTAMLKIGQVGGQGAVDTKFDAQPQEC